MRPDLWAAQMTDISDVGHVWCVCGVVNGALVVYWPVFDGGQEAVEELCDEIGGLLR